MSQEEIKSTNEKQEGGKTPEVNAEAPLTIEQIEAQTLTLQANLEEMKKSSQQMTQVETARIDKTVEELGVGNPEETVAVKTEVKEVEEEKQAVLKTAENKLGEKAEMAETLSEKTDAVVEKKNELTPEQKKIEEIKEKILEAQEDEKRGEKSNGQDRTMHFREAAKSYEEAENITKAREMWDKSAEATGETDQLLSIYEQSHNQIAKDKLIARAQEIEKQGQEFMTADIFEKIGWKADAERLYNKVIDRAYKDKSYLEAAALSSERLGQEDQAKRFYEAYADKLWQSQTRESDFLFKLAAEAYEKAGKIDSAKGCWEKYADKLSNDESFKQTPFYYADVAKAYEKAGNNVKAEEMWAQNKLKSPRL